MQKNSQTDNPQPKDLYWIGVLAEIKKTALGDKGEINALVKGLKKISVLKFIKEEPYFEAEWKKINDQVVEDEEMQAMIKYISSQVKKAINLGKTLDLVSLMNVMNVINPLDFSYQVAVILDIKNTQKQALLEETNVKERLRKEIDYIDREVKILEIEHNISFKTQKKFEEGMKETLLREKKRTIEEELGERGEDKEISEYRQKIKKAKMPPLVEEKALKELKRLAQMSQFNPETSYLRTYLDWLVEMPWSTTSKTVIDIKKAERF
jgi:ATP-dependent Lon protease